MFAKFVEEFSIDIRWEMDHLLRRLEFASRGLRGIALALLVSEPQTGNIKLAQEIDDRIGRLFDELRTDEMSERFREDLGFAVLALGEFVQNLALDLKQTLE